MMFNNYPISYLKAFLRNINTWDSRVTTRENKITYLRALTVFKHTSLSNDFRKAWGLPR